MMVTVTKDQWLELHRRTLDCIRAVIRGISSEMLLWEPETTKGKTKETSCHEPRPFCIGAIIAHLCDTDVHWLDEVGMIAKFAAPRQADRNARMFETILDLIEQQYREVLTASPKDRHVLFGMGRVCQHNLHHLAQIVHLRCLQESEWQPPAAGQPGSWEHAADYITDLLILGDKATHTASQGGENDRKGI